MLLARQAWKRKVNTNPVRFHGHELWRCLDGGILEETFWKNASSVDYVTGFEYVRENGRFLPPLPLQLLCPWRERVDVFDGVKSGDKLSATGARSS